MILSKKLIDSIKIFILLVLTVLASSIILVISLVGIYCIPLNRGNFAESESILLSEGDRPDVLERNTGDWANAGSFEPGIVSTSNELANLYRAGGMDDQSPIYNAIVMDSANWGPYPRYWHYYAGIMRILLILFDIKEIRFLNFIFQLLLVMAIMRLVSEKKGFIASLLVLTMYFLMMPIAVSSNSVYSFGLDGTLLFTYLFLLICRRKGEKILDDKLIYICFCIMGVMICALDQLITCIVAWAFPALLLIYLYGENRKNVCNLITVIASGISWIIGYAGSWMAKILIAEIYMKSDVLGEAVDRTSFWAEGVEEFSPGRLFSLYTVYKHYTYKLFAIIIILWIIYLSIKMIRSGINSDSRIPSLFLVSLGPVVWNLVLYEHVYYHHIFTYRQLSVSIVGLLLILRVASDESKDKEYSKGLMSKIGILAGALILGVLITAGMKETQDVYNADIAGEYIPFDDLTRTVSINIIPSYKHIRELSLGICPVSDEGKYDFRLLENGDVIDEFSIPASEYFENSWKDINVDWNLKKSREYKLEITAVGTAPGSKIYVLNEQVMSPTDLSGLRIGDELTYARPIFWIKYQRMPLKRDFVFYSLTYYLVILTLLITVYNIVKGKNKDISNGVLKNG